MICLSPDRVAFHKATEAASVFLAAPFALFLAFKGYGLPSWARVGLVALSVSILVVDGGLLMLWRQPDEA